jgi:hypothetical protein
MSAMPGAGIIARDLEFKMVPQVTPDVIHQSWP